MADEFLGVPTPILIAIGKVMVIAGRVEAMADDMAAAFNLDTTQLQFAQTCKHIRKALKCPYPPWITMSTQPVEQWTKDASSAMGMRNQRIHVLHASRPHNSRWQPINIHQRTKEVNSTELEFFEEVQDKLVQVWDHGQELLKGLHPDLKPNVTIHVFARAAGRTDQHITVYHTDDGYPSRPMQADLEDFDTHITPMFNEYAIKEAASHGQMSDRERESIPPPLYRVNLVG